MKQLEDRIKDRLEGYESSLPEGDLAEFKALLDASAKAGKKRSPAYLAWLAPVAVASGLALFLVLGHGPEREDMIQMVDGGLPIADVVETLPVEAVYHTETKPAAEAVNNDPTSGNPERIAAEQKENSPSVPSGSKGGNSGGNDGNPGSMAPVVGSPTSAKPTGTRPISVKVGKATAGVLGGSGILALASVIPSLTTNADAMNGDFSDAPVVPGGIWGDTRPSTDGRTGNDTHYMPLCAGLSLRIPFSDRWSLTTGVDYSWYASRLEHYLSGVHDQSVHYLGIPLRADFTIARNRWMDVYAGVGGSADFCVAAYDAGQKIARDGVGFSLVGAGGIQFNISRNLSLYLDPAISWDIPSDKRILDTYRSENPFRFTLSTGLRFSLPSIR